MAPQEQKQYQGPERRQSQSQYQGEERRRPAPVTGMRTQQRLDEQEERTRQQQARFDDIH